VIIVGGGIGGLTMALAAQRARLEARVFERAPNIEAVQVGSGITIYGNAMRVYRELGAMEAMRANGGVVEWQDFYSWKGRKLGRWESGELAQRARAINLSAPRGVLHKALLERLEPGTVECCNACTGFEESGDSVTAHFEDGSNAEGDVLIGADGFGSVIRPQLLGDEGRKYRYAGLTSWNAVVDFDHEPTHGVQASVYGRGSRFLWVHLGDGRVGWVAAAMAPEGESDPPEGTRSSLIERFRDWASPVPEMIAASDERGIRRLDVVDREPVTRWGRGRVTLMGDAAHPMTFFLGQGACSAIEDAFVLGRRMRIHGATPEALRAYEAARIENANWTVKASWRLGKLVAIRSRVGSATRNAGVKAMSPLMFNRLIGRVDQLAREEDAAFAAAEASNDRASAPEHAQP
jgi:2-polyprenyl-6-methoxyphenol hydroxylase-like FAD-dependent oxidoreductase